MTVLIGSLEPALFKALIIISEGKPANSYKIWPSLTAQTQ
jgi:hypothetical protein